MATTKTQKQVTVLATYKFNKVARICFTVRSSNGLDKYNTCFQGNGHESCGCPSKGGCYHRDQLRPVAQAFLESLKLAQEEQRSNAPLNQRNSGFSLMR